MSIFFLNSTNRLYNDSEFNAVAKLLFSNGVFNTQQATQALWRLGGDFFIESAGGTMNITAKPGMASIEITITEDSETKTVQTIIKEDLQLSASVASNPSLAFRNDAVVLRISQSIIDADELNVEGSNAVSLVVVSGNSANALSDSAISVSLGGDAFIRLANILVPQNATEITDTMITDVRTLVKMTRATKLASDRLRLYALDSDPDVLEEGDIWFNVDEGILKFYDGENIVALQSQDFSWGYYPPNGIERYDDKFEPVTENDSATGFGNISAWFLYYVSPRTQMFRQIIKMPNVSNPLIRFKMGNPPDKVNLPITVGVYAVDGNNVPTTLIENFTIENVPINDYIQIALDGSLYSQGVNYTIIFHCSLSYASDNYPYLYAQTAFIDDNEFLIGTQIARDTNGQSDPLSMDWTVEPVNTDANIILDIRERDEIAIGQTDTSGKNYQIIQSFIAKAKDIQAIQIIRGANIGTPTGNINTRLYNANTEGKPIGNMLAQGEFSGSDWNNIVAGDFVELPIYYDELTVGSRYAIVIDCDIQSDTDNYTVFFGSTAINTSYRNTTAEGFISLNGEIYFGIKVSPVRKIVVLDDNGEFDSRLLSPKVLETEASGNFAYSTKFDYINITNVTGNITSMTTEMIKENLYPFRKIIFLFKQTSNRTISWGAMFETMVVAPTTSLLADKYTRVEFEYNPITEKFGCISSITQA